MAVFGRIIRTSLRLKCVELMAEGIGVNGYSGWCGARSMWLRVGKSGGFK